jgi:hypothetical protein
MSIQAIEKYITLSALFGQKSSSAGSSDSLLGVSSTRKTDLCSLLESDSSSISSDSADISDTAGFFSKLQQLEETDPDTYKATVKKLGEIVQGARGYEGYALTSLAQQVADGADIADVILKGSSSKDTGSSTESLSSKINQLISSLLGTLGSDEETSS